MRFLTTRLIFVLSFISALFLRVYAAESENISAYFKAPLQTEDELKKTMSEQKFEWINTSPVLGSLTNKVVVFTHPELKTLASKKDRGPAAFVRIQINETEKELLATNPLYFGIAFLQKDVEEKKLEEVTNALKSALKTPTPSEDVYQKAGLSKYRFMFGMPYYEDFITIKRGSQQDLLKKFKETAKENVLFETNLGSSVIMGVRLQDRTEKLLQTIQQKNKAVLFPYLIIFDGESAKILHPKYYIAISFPLLTMTQFMKISDAPGNIETDFEKFFK